MTSREPAAAAIRDAPRMALLTLDLFLRPPTGLVERAMFRVGFPLLLWKRIQFPTRAERGELDRIALERR